MPVKKINHANPANGKIDLNNKEEINLWARKLGCTNKILRAAIRYSDGSPEAIRKIITDKYKRERNGN